ncbi:hypothetical protein BKA61DRAFT_587513, partial [Leptodontidium sp. MPI-SDFR-AT-0119]
MKYGPYSILLWSMTLLNPGVFADMDPGCPIFAIADDRRKMGQLILLFLDGNTYWITTSVSEISGTSSQVRWLHGKGTAVLQRIRLVSRGEESEMFQPRYPTSCELVRSCRRCACRCCCI